MGELNIIEGWVHAEVPKRTNLYRKDGAVFVEHPDRDSTVKITHHSGRGMLKVERVKTSHDAWCAMKKDDLIDLVEELLKA